jgi:hypothetical protein
MTLPQAFIALPLLALAACGSEVNPSSVEAASDTGHAGLAGLKPPETWGMASSSGSGPSEIIRYREHGKAIREAGLHSHRLILTRKYERFPPGDLETREVDQLEDDLCEVLEPGNQALLWLVRTGDRKRHWVFYCANTAEVVSRLERVGLLIAPHRTTMVVERDEEWAMYREFTPK